MTDRLLNDNEINNNAAARLQDLQQQLMLPDIPFNQFRGGKFSSLIQFEEEILITLQSMQESAIAAAETLKQLNTALQVADSASVIEIDTPSFIKPQNHHILLESES
ncbi:MAG: hypothetical protein Q4C71_01745 [Microbacteriaceae bacterium]|nr:hypothetical protein [Microbacteriaceae bacterium]